MECDACTPAPLPPTSSGYSVWNQILFCRYALPHYSTVYVAVVPAHSVETTVGVAVVQAHPGEVTVHVAVVQAHLGK